MIKYAVIIIGGGPAGAVCGIALQRAGISTCIFDKAVFPRDKLCGGLLTKKTMDLLGLYCPEIPPENFIVKETQSVEFYYRDETILRFSTRIPLYLTERTLLDEKLINLYKTLGGTVFGNAAIRPHQIDLASNTLQFADKTYHFEVLVGAYGCGNLLAKPHSIKADHSFCIEGKAVMKSPENAVRIYFGHVRGGYGWDFPKKDHFTVGTLEVKRGRRISESFFRDIIKKDMHSVHGALIPSGRKVALKKLRQNVLLAGDSAGFTDPVTGEGIYYAILSGKITAESVQKAIRNGNGKYLDDYLQKVRTIRRNIRDANFLKKILYHPLVLKHFMHFIRRHPSLALFYVEEMVSQYRYRYRDFVFQYLWRRFIKGERWG
ncbi:MAG: NAD(P)/FAD-dependent oxidoreductase [Bacteroidales bacterium]|nr:NAD(P)/FAD-dependent oxidoreductase [Lentimicrobiaceae bacterium]MDD5695900.1 NAD(P)/FAD-dependent oxidoreductase [Bacteroidales bacterium]